MKVPSFFNNKIVRWVFLALAVMNIIGYLSTSAYECLLVFAVGYALTDNYCNNQSCSILGALFAANFVWGCGRVKETFVEAMKGAKEHAQDASSSATKAASAALKEGMTDDEKQAMLEAAQAAAAAATKAEHCKAGGGGDMTDEQKNDMADQDFLQYKFENDSCSVSMKQ